MTVFRDAEQAKDFLGGFWADILEDPEVGTRLKETGMSVTFKLSDPDLVLYIDQDGLKWNREAGQMKPDLTLTMSADTVHRFWLKKLNVAKALATRQVRSKGPIQKVMKLLPLLGPANRIYVEHCEASGMPVD